MIHNDYRIQRVVENAERTTAEASLLAEVFPEAQKYSPEFLKWQYYMNPRGAVVGYDAYCGSELAAHYVGQPLEAELFGRQARGLLSFNTATSPSHQGKGLFTALASATFQLAREEGYEFVIGVANANSTPGFTRKLGFQLVAQLDADVGVGHVETPPIDMADFKPIWNEEARSWRVRPPHGRYWSERGTLYAATHLPLLAMQLCASGYKMQASKAPHVLTGWLGLHPSRVRRGAALPIPRRFRPSPLNLIFLDLTNANRRLRNDRVCFEAVDFDAY